MMLFGQVMFVVREDMQADDYYLDDGPLVQQHCERLYLE